MSRPDLGRARAWLPDAATAALTLAFAWACTRFVWQPGLATFADDSVSYLVMAQVFSPFRPASQAVAEAFVAEASYAPLFPLVLALSGAAHDLAWAHAATALMLAACLPALYALASRWLESRGAAALAVLTAMLLPALWVNAKGILSEPLFCLLLLGALRVQEAPATRGRAWALTLLMAALLLTRAAALAPILGYALWAGTRAGMAPAARLRAALPALAALAPYAAWMLLRPAATPESYLRILVDFGARIGASGDAWFALGASVARQLEAMAEAWLGALLIYWVEGRPLRSALAAALGALALAGLALRIAAGKADGWMLAAYLLMFLLWPFYEQMGRFLFPVLPVLVLYAFFAASHAARALRMKRALAHAMVAMVALSLVLPALAFIYQRARMDESFAAVTDWYRTPDILEARARAQTQLDLFADMEAIRALTRAEDRVMWVAPAYVALLAGRRGVSAPAEALAPEAYRRAVREAGADYVFLSRYDPRNTLSDAAWQAGAAALLEGRTVLHARVRGDGTLSSVLLKAAK